VAKLSIADKKEILRLYCETDATTTQLAKQYEISSSTVLRLLQELIPPEEYKQIVSQKQSKTKKSTASPSDSALQHKKAPQPEINQLNLIDNLSDREVSYHGAFNSVFDAPPNVSLNVPKEQPDFVNYTGETLAPNTAAHNTAVTSAATSKALDPKSLDKSVGKPITKQAQLKRQAEEQLEQRIPTGEIAYNAQNFIETELPIHLGSDISLERTDNLIDPDILLNEFNNEIIVESAVDDEFEEDDEDDGDDSDLEDDLDEGFEEEDGDFADMAILSGGDRNANANVVINILPLEDAELPSTCYMVVDKSAEIITRPLRDFKELGLIPPEENQSKTVALFDNHRIARRFSNQNQRVIKFPGDLIYATHEKLAQRGITRLLFGGHVYAL
jgi:transposase-like protein